MTVLAIEDTLIYGTDVCVTAVVDEMRLLYRATHFEPEEYAPALCRAYFSMDEGEQIPTDEDGFCQYLDSLNLDWEILPVEND
jgi:hypothetical protein